MTNEEKTPALVKAVLSDNEIAELINKGGIKPGKASPLAQIRANNDTGTSHLQQLGFLDLTNHPTSNCLEFLNILANPGSEIDLIWGNPDSLSLSKVYCAPGKDRLVSFTSINGSNHLSYFLSSANIIELVTEKIAHPEIKEARELIIDSAPSTVPVLLASLDLFRESQLKAVLERRQDFRVKITPDEINRIIQEASLENNFNWYTPAGYLTTADNPELNGVRINEGIEALRLDGWIQANGELDSRFKKFACAAFPLISFLGIKVFTQTEKTQISLFRGISSLLFFQLTSDNGVNKALINSISTSRLPEILYNLTTPLFEPNLQASAPASNQAAPKTIACPNCGAANAQGSKFCVKCGKSLSVSVSIKYCTKCGAPVKAGSNFCEKCGNKSG